MACPPETLFAHQDHGRPTLAVVDADHGLTNPAQVVCGVEQLQAAMVRVVGSARASLAIVGSRSRDRGYRATIVEVLRRQSRLVHWRVLVGPPQRQVLKDHLLRLLHLREPADRTYGMQTLHLGMVEDQLREPERFVRHTFATWLEDAGIPARVIDEVMGHEATSRTGQQPGSAMGAHYRHTTREMAARIAMAIEQFWTQTPQYRPVGLAMGTRTCGAVLSSDDHGSSVERTAKLHPLWRERSGLPSVRGRVQAAGALQ